MNAYRFERLPPGWPFDGGRKFWATLGWAVTLVAGMVYFVFFANDDAPEMLPKLSGCFASKYVAPGAVLMVDSAGTIRSGKFAMPAKAQEDKIGASLLPRYSVIYNVARKWVTTDGQQYRSLRFDDDFQSFGLPSSDGGTIIMTRSPARVCLANRP